MCCVVDAGVVCLKYHAGLSITQRREAHHKFLRDEVQVCTYTLPMIVLSRKSAAALISIGIRGIYNIESIGSIEFSVNVNRLEHV